MGSRLREARVELNVQNSIVSLPLRLDPIWMCCELLIIL